ncbi:MAG: type II toxin-antitoxin system RelB/DinJ family antitoxin [Lachnospiraceae bacterium]|nr:type II toxin-antitoxin system RelB/DinJ family antitoxin [Lachnospiraceae bacterium]
MEKTATLNLRVNPVVKERAENVLSQLGIPMSTAIDMYLNQIALVGGIPFSVVLPKVPASVNADMMSEDELHAKLGRGYADIQDGKVQDAASAFSAFREKHEAIQSRNYRGGAE